MRGEPRRGTPADLLVVGLGNPGAEYSRSRHNVGFDVVDLLARRHGGRLRKGKEKAFVDEVRIGGSRVALAQPQTYMNESGQSVLPLVRRFGIEDLQRLVIVHDELDLPLGRMKVKEGGGLAGHNGLRSIKAHLHADDFVRIRIGVGKPPSKEQGADHVLKRMGKASRTVLDEVCELAADAVELILAEGVGAAMTRYNATDLAPGGMTDRAVDRDQASFLRSVTHDLRTPLAAIRAIVTDLHDGPEHDAETTSELLQTVCDEVDRLDRLVGNLLRMSAIDAGALEPETQAIEVAELIEHRIKVLAPLLRDHTVIVAITDDCPLAQADYGQLDEVLTNLLGNAVRHVPEGTTITISAAARGRDLVVIAVADHGPGIDAGARDELRRPFSRGVGSRSTGLGLAVCDAIVGAHGGTLTISDTPGGGATISFTVPAVGS